MKTILYEKKWDSAILLIILLMFFPNITSGQMPLHPNLVKQLQAGTLTKQQMMTIQSHNEMQGKGVDAPWSDQSLQLQKSNSVGFTRSYGPSKTPTGNWKALVLLVQFSDKPAQVQASSFDNLIYSQQSGTLWDYYKKVSYGSLDIVTVNLPSSTGWYTAPNTYAYYVNGANGFGSYPQNAQKLVEDVVNLADPAVDFSKYDNNGDGYVDALFIVHTGPGAEFTGSSNDIWSHAWSTSYEMNVDGVKVSRYSMEPEYWQSPGDMTIGVFAHELGHAAFGLPDLYDRDYSSQGLGNWSLMASGSWGGNNGNSPSFPDAWSQAQMGFVTPQVIAANETNKIIKEVETSPNVFFLRKGGVVGNEYYLIENRQKTGFDASLPASGLNIYHIDESVVTQNDKEWYPGHTNSGHYLVALEQADGLWNLEHGNNRGDAGDTYPGSTSNPNFSNSSIPNSKDYMLTATGVAVKNISAPDTNMTADFEITTTDKILRVVTPNGGEKFQVGFPQSIILDALNTGTVKVEYTTDNGNTWTLINNVDPSIKRSTNSVVIDPTSGLKLISKPELNITGSVLTWIVPNLPSSQCKIRATSISDTTITDMSDNTFSIVSSVDQGKVTLRYDNGVYSTRIGSNGAATYEASARFTQSIVAPYVGWNLKELEIYVGDIPLSFKIKIYDAGTSANPGVLLYSQNVTPVANSWNTFTLTTPVAISSKDIWVGYEVGVSGNYPMGADSGPATADGDWIYVNNGWHHLSDYGMSFNWSIHAICENIQNIRVLSPNGGEIIGVGRTVNIKWVSGLVENVKIELTTDNGGSWSTISSSTPSNSGKYSWTVPNSISNECRIKISKVADTAVYDESDSLFSIRKSVKNIDELMNDAKFLLMVETNSAVDTTAILTHKIGSDITIQDGFVYWEKTLNEFNRVQSIYVGVAGLNTSAVIRVAINGSGKMYIGSFGNNLAEQLSLFTGKENGVENYDDFDWNFLAESVYGSPKDIFISNSIKQNRLSYILRKEYNSLKVEGFISNYLENGNSLYKCNFALKNNTNNKVILLKSFIYHQQFDYSWYNPLGRPIEQKRNALWSPIAYHPDQNANLERSFNLTYVNPVYSSVLAETGTDNGMSGSVRITGLNNPPDYSSSGGDTRNWSIEYDATNSFYQVNNQNCAAATINLFNQYPSFVKMWGNTTWSSYNQHFFIAVMGDDITVSNNVEQPSPGDDNNPLPMKLIINPGWNYDTPKLTLFSPNGGETWKVGSKHSIRWDSEGIQNVKIEYTNDRVSWMTVESSISASEGNYSWVVPTTISNKCKVRISNVDNSAISTVSNNDFSIIGYGVLSEEEPNNTLQQAMSVSYADTVDASVNPVDDVDYYRIEGVQGDTIQVYSTHRNNSGILGWIRLLDQNGSYVYENRSFAGDGLQQRIVYVLPYTGTYYIRYAFVNNWNGVPPAEKEKYEREQKKNPAALNGPQLNYNQGDYRITFTYFKKSAPIIGFAYTTDLNHNSTRFGGQIYPNGLDTKVTIDYGTSASYGNSVVVTTNANSLNELYFTSDKITGLQANTQYHYRVTLQNSQGTTQSGDYLFTTPQAPDGWTYQNSGVTNTIRGIKFYDTNVGYVVGAGVILKTIDGGVNWVTKRTSGSYNALEVIDTNTVVAVGYQGIISKTTDGGETWTDKQVGCYGNMSVSFKDANNGVLVTYCGEMYKTTDGGANWSSIPISATHWDLYAVKYLSTGVIIAAGYNNCVLRSTDDGITWTSQRLNNAWGLLMSISFKDLSNGIVVGYRGLVYKTTDGGATWNAMNFGSNTDLFGVAYLNDGRAYTVGTNGFVFKSIDDGNTWAQMLSGTTNGLYGVCAAGVSPVYVVGSWGTILKSQNYLRVVTPNGGENWKVGAQKNIRWSSNGVENVKIEYSTDNGTTYTQLTASTAASAGAYSWTVPNILSNQCKVKVTSVTDGSMSDVSDGVFSIVGNGPIAEVEPNNTLQEAMSVSYADTVDASINPVNDVDYYRIEGVQGDTLQIYSTHRNNSGILGWIRLLDQNGSYVYENRSFAGDGLQQRIVYVLPYTGTYYIRYAFVNNWNGVPPAEKEKYEREQKKNPAEIKGPQLDYNQGDYRITFTYFKKSTPLFGYAGNTDLNYNSTRFYGQIYPNGLDTKVTIDYGTSASYGSGLVVTTNANSLNDWYFTSDKITGLQANTQYHYRVTLQNSQGTTQSGDYLFTTPQAPDGWAYQNSGVTNTIRGIKFYDANVGYAVGAGIILKTSDGGTNWVTKRSSGDYNALEVIDANTVIVVGYQGIVSKTTDGGETWTDKQVGCYGNMSVSFKDANNGVLVTYCGEMYKTTDGGANWSSVPISATHSYLYTVKYLSNGVIIAAGYNNYVLRSADDGSTWTSQQLNNIWYPFESISFKDLSNGVIVGYRGLVYKTTDGGTTWNSISLGSNTDLFGVTYLNNGSAIAVGYGGNIFKSIDDGNTWAQMLSGTTNWLFGACTTGNNMVYGVGDWGTIITKQEQNPIKWKTDIALKNKGNSSVVITFGGSQEATDGIDSQLGEKSQQFANGVFDARFELPINPTDYSIRDYRNDAQDSIKWQIDIQSTTNDYPIVLKWDKSKLSNGSFYLRDIITGSIVNVDMRNNDSCIVSNSGIKNLTIIFKKQISKEIRLLSGWNMVSSPVQANDMRTSTVFNSANSKLYAYENGYKAKDTLELESGYWIRYPVADTINISGIPSNKQTILLKNDWNMIGGYDRNIIVNNVTTTPANILTSKFFGYDNGYKSVDTLKSGAGYWIRANQAGVINLTNALAKSSGNLFANAQIDANWGKIFIMDRNGASTTLYIAKDNVNLDYFELPPAPPKGIPDVRWESNKNVEILGGSGKDIVLNSLNYPIEIRVEGITLKLTDKVGGAEIDKILRSGERASINNSAVERLEVLEREIPISYSLYQNYPNPFNPSTVIKFALPEKTKVRLTIYNTLGQRVEELINEELEAGYYENKWNATRISTGVYFYELRTDRYREVKKMLLIK